MELWAAITVFAAFAQNLRSALQKHLRKQLTTGGATFSRFVFAAPFAVVLAVMLWMQAEGQLPRFSLEFFVYCVLGGIIQIIATGLLVSLFSFRNFAVGTAYSKTETVQAAIFGLILVGDTITLQAAAGIALSLIGVITLSAANTGFNRGLGRDLVGKPALIGLASGATFGLCAVCYRAASLSLGDAGFLIQASTTLAVVLVLQTLAMGAWLAWREPGQAVATIRAWRVSLPAGLAGFLASIGWFSAMTLQNAAYVRAVGQVELVFTVLSSWIFFREKIKVIELLGVFLVGIGIVVIVL